MASRITADRKSSALLAFAAIASVWGIWVAATGGTVVNLGGLPISFRSSQRPFFLSAVLTFCYLGATARKSRALERFGPPKRLWIYSGAALGLALLLAWAAVTYGAFIAGGSDSYGYLSQAELWRHGRLQVDQPWVAELPWPEAIQAAAPVGYRPGLTRNAIVPTYPAGLPLLFAVGDFAFGKTALNFIIPMLAALTIWLTYLLAREAPDNPLGGFLAAAVMATSSVFIFLSMWPMTDVPVTAFWTLALWAGIRKRPAAFWAGLAGGMAILIRPNLLPLIIVLPIAWSIDGVSQLRGRSLRFSLGAAPAIVAVALINNRLYGSPWTSGYGDLGGLYSPGNLSPNIAHYVSWLTSTETWLLPLGSVGLLFPAVWAGDKAGVRLIRRAFLMTIVVVSLAYAFYQPFDVWWYLRFLLPMFPVLAVAFAATVVWLGRHAASRSHAYAVIAILTIPVVVTASSEALARGAFNLQSFETRYVTTAQDVQRATPERAIVLADQHSGSIRYGAAPCDMCLFHPTVSTTS